MPLYHCSMNIVAEIRSFLYYRSFVNVNTTLYSVIAPIEIWLITKYIRNVQFTFKFVDVVNNCCAITILTHPCNAIPDGIQVVRTWRPSFRRDDTVNPEPIIWLILPANWNISTPDAQQIEMAAQGLPITTTLRRTTTRPPLNKKRGSGLKTGLWEDNHMQCVEEFVLHVDLRSWIKW